MNHSRYSKQIKLKGFGTEGQEKLAAARILIIGAGGLGTPVAQYLNAMGIGQISLMDADRVEESNLARQSLFTPADIGQYKTDCLIKRLSKQNPGTNLTNIREYLLPRNALKVIESHDLVIDASDNFGTRYLVNDACVILGKPFIYGALHGFEGQVSVLNFHGGPTYRCLFPESTDHSAIANCDENGVLGVLPGLIGTYQAIEAVKIISGIGEVLSGKLLIIDSLTQTHLKIGVPNFPENHVITSLKTTYGQGECELSSPIEKQTVQHLLEKLSNSEALQLIDVRSQEEFHQHSLPSAKNIPLQQLTERMQEINAELPVYLICQSGKRSLQAAQMLQTELPNTKLYSISDGMAALHNINN